MRSEASNRMGAAAQQRMMLRSMACLLLVAASYQQYPALTNTKGKMLDSYGPIVNECKHYMGGTIVMSRILDSAKKGLWANVKKIYSTEVLKTDPYEPLEYYARARNGEFIKTTPANQRFWQKGKTYYNNKITYVHDYFSSSNDVITVETGLVWISFLWLGNQLDNSRYFMTAAGRAKGKITGGASEVDDTACLYISFKNKVFSLWKFYGTVDKNYGAGKCPSTNAKIVQLLRLLHREAVANQKVAVSSFTTTDAAYDEVLDTMCVGNLRAVLWQTSIQTKASQAYAYGYLLPCAPLFKASVSATNLRKLLQKTTVVATKAEVAPLVQEIAKRGTRGLDMSKLVFCA